MSKRALVLVAVLTLAGTTPAQDLKNYLALRARYGVTQSFGVETLETLLGTRVVEVKGIVKGSFRVGDSSSLLLERTDGQTIVIDVPKMPEWMVDNNLHARLLVKATRVGEYGQLNAKLLGACPEEEMAKWELAHRPKPKVTPKPKSPSKPSLYGPIGKRHAKNWFLPASDATPIYAGFIKSRNRRLSNDEALKIATGIVGFSIKYGVDARLIMAMVMAESGFDPRARSSAGAMGLGQLMPGTAGWMGVNNVYDSIDNLYGTVKLIRRHIDDYRRRTGDEYQSLVLALAAYNAGTGAVSRHGGVPPYRETQRYIRKVITLYNGFLGN